MSARITRFFVVGLLTVVSLTLGCSRVTQENFDKINSDMSLEQVESFLGKGEIVQDPGKDLTLSTANQFVPKEHEGKPVTTVRWRSGRKVIYVYFIGEKRDKNVFKYAEFP